MKIKRYFLSGLVVVLPVLITVYLIVSLFFFFDNVFGRYLSQLMEAKLGFSTPPGLGILFFIVILFVVGLVATNFFGRRLFLVFERLWLLFPGVKKIYPAAKQITKFLFAEGAIEKRKVVLVEFPRKGIYSLGFATNKCKESVRAKIGKKEYFNVFVPLVPSPFSGHLLIIAKEEITFLDMSIEEALKLIVSGGALNPDELEEEVSA